MVFDQKMIRDYLQRLIANHNKRISGMLKSFATKQKEVNAGYNEILHFFAINNNSAPLRTITDFTMDNPTKNYSSYNFFDIDSLIAYEQYLSSILREVDLIAYENGRSKSNKSDYRKGFRNAQTILVNKARTEVTGFYNPQSPIRLAYTVKNGEKYIDPKRTLSPDAFEKKYGDGKKCREELDRYIQHRFMSVEEKKVQSVEPTTMDYRYKGIDLKLNVDRKDYYTDINGSGLTSIVASGKMGTLFGTYYNDGSVYEGDLYDLDGELVSLDGGGEEFIETIHKIVPPEFEELFGDQLSLW